MVLLDAKGQPVKLSFFDLFGASKPSRSGKGTPSREKKKPKKEESSSTETSPASTAATEVPTESTKTTESGSAEWTRIEELALLGMKAQNMSWKEIGEALPGKDMEDIKKKYRELYVVAPANVKQKETEARKEETKKDENNKEEKKEKNEEVAKSDEAKAAEASKESGDGKKGGKEGKQAKKGQKGQKEQKGTEKAKEAKVEQAKPEEAKVEQAKPEEAKEEEAKPDTKTGILKAKATKGEKGKGGELKSINGHPVIFVDDNEELEFDELLYLYGLNARYDEQKWITVDSKFFDKFGKRVGAKKLKDKLAGSC